MTDGKVAQIIIISTVISTSIVLAVLFAFNRALFISQTAPQLNTSSAVELVSNEERLISAVERANVAVVSVVVTKDIPIYERYLETIDPWGWFLLPQVREKGTESREIGGGTGFLVSNDGLLVTNRHVVSDKDARYSIIMSTGTTYSVDVVAIDVDLDIAILKISEPLQDSLPYLSFGNSNTLRLGQTVVAIGNALAEFQNTISVGVVSGLARTIIASDGTGRREQLDQVIQTDAAINPGNSGGPLLNLDGEVIGVNVATSQGADNISFALPGSVVRQIVASVKKYGEIVRPVIGVRYMNVNAATAETRKLSSDFGALILPGDNGEPAVIPDSAAAKAGLLEGDIIIKVDTVSLRTIDLTTALRSKGIGDTVLLTIVRGDTEREVEVLLERAL